MGMLFDREWMDQHLPHSKALYRLAISLCGTNKMEDQLQWLAKLSEDDAFPRPPWKEERRADGSHYHDIAWALRVDGLNYKSRLQYLTAEGWPMGTACWYVQVDGGWRELITGETPSLALARAIIFVSVALIWRNTAPDERIELADMVSAAAIAAQTGKSLEDIVAARGGETMAAADG